MSILALLFDLLLGDPPNRLHPTAWMGSLIAFLDHFRPQDFAYLARVLDEKAGIPNNAPGDEPIYLSSNTENGVTLRILGLGIFLFPVDFLSSGSLLSALRTKPE